MHLNHLFECIWWLTDRPTKTDQWTDRPTDQPINWPTNWRANQPTDQLTHRTDCLMPLCMCTQGHNFKPFDLSAPICTWAKLINNLNSCFGYLVPITTYSHKYLNFKLILTNLESSLRAASEQPQGESLTVYNFKSNLYPRRTQWNESLLLGNRSLFDGCCQFAKCKGSMCEHLKLLTVTHIYQLHPVPWEGVAR